MKAVSLTAMGLCGSGMLTSWMNEVCTDVSQLHLPMDGLVNSRAKQEVLGPCLVQNCPK